MPKIRRKLTRADKIALSARTTEPVLQEAVSSRYGRKTNPDEPLPARGRDGYGTMADAFESAKRRTTATMLPLSGRGGAPDTAGKTGPATPRPRTGGPQPGSIANPIRISRRIEIGTKPASGNAPRPVR